MRITVLLGGPSAEREISLISGKAVADALRAVGHEVFESDIAPDDLSGLDHPADVVFPVLHGAFGESGELQEIFEQRGIPFVGSGSAASRISIDKIATKRVWKSAGLPTPPCAVITRAVPVPTIPAPLVVKPIDSGSSIDVIICRTRRDIDRACEQVLQKHSRAMAETFIEGPELTVGLLEEQPLDPIHIVPKRAFFDFEAKYKNAGTQHLFDLTDDIAQRCRELAREANRALGCRDLGRIDIMLDAQSDPHLLEINTMPGFTPTSLLPEAAAHAGITFGDLVDRLVRRAYDRGTDAAPQVFIAPEMLKRRAPARKSA
jgi:D-alanine-D-alanine ligase